MSKKCLIFLDSDNIQNSIDLVEVAARIYPDDNYETFGVSINNDFSKALGFFDFIVKISDSEISSYDPMIITDALEELHKTYEFDSILIPASAAGRIIAPRLAMRIHSGLVADVTDLSHVDGVLEMIRPAFSGKIMAGIQKSGNGPTMMTVRENVFSLSETFTKKTQVIDIVINNKRESKIRQIRISDKKQSYNIQDSEVLISGGGGIKSDFSKLERLAASLKGDVSASRKLVDHGLASRSIQVGQSGKTVSPKLYMALGIDGAIQHIEGLKNVEHIISVNTNKNAPICSLSDLVVVGDASKFVDLLMEKINQKN